MLGWKMLRLERSLGSRIVTYADDLVILCRRGKAEEALQQLRKIMSKLKLTVNEEKTRICKVPEEEFDFLGYSFGRMYSARTGRARLGYSFDLARRDRSRTPFGGVLRSRFALAEFFQFFPRVRQTVLRFAQGVTLLGELTVVLLVQGVENRSKFGRAVLTCRFSPRCVRPKNDSSANKREASHKKRYAQCSHAGHTDVLDKRETRRQTATHLISRMPSFSTPCAFWLRS